MMKGLDCCSAHCRKTQRSFREKRRSGHEQKPSGFEKSSRLVNKAPGKPALYPGLLLYRCLLWLALPVVVVRLWWRGRKDAAYRPRWRERFGFYTAPISSGTVWFHTVSAGESIAAAPMIRQLLQSDEPSASAMPLLVTTMTPTGSEQVLTLLGDQVDHCYAPYDFTFAVRRCLAQTKPRALILMETEIWPNLILEAKSQGINVVLINARLSEKSARGYQRLSWLAKPVLKAIDLIACQTQEHAQRFASLGVSPQRLQVVGNVKYDLDNPADLARRAAVVRGQLSAGPKRSWIAASTHPGEEELVLQAHHELLQSDPNLVLWLAPRHPNRLSELAPLLNQLTAKMPGGWCCYSDLAGRAPATAPQVSVVVVDQMGVLMPLYELVEVAFIGGSLVPHGGHNPIEPASVHTPVITGPNFVNFSQVFADLINANAGKVVDQHSLVEVIAQLLEDPEQRQKMGTAGGEVVAANQGAKQRSVALIEQVLAE